MPGPRVYPSDDCGRPHERHWGPKKRAWMYDQEATHLGNAQRRLTGDDSEKSVGEGRIMHGRLIQPGKRPLLRAPRSFLDRMGTERQQRRGKVRTARSWGRMLDAMEKAPMTMEEFVETLSPEELVRGRLKDSEGKFRGRPPAWVPAEFHRACIRELMRRGKHLWQTNYLEAIEAMTRVAKGEVKGATVRDRLTAAQFVIERIEGKQPETVVIREDAPWQMVIDDIVAQVPDEAIAAARHARENLGAPTLEDTEPDVIDAEIVEENEVQPPRRRRRAASRRAR